MTQNARHEQFFRDPERRDDLNVASAAIAASGTSPVFAVEDIEAIRAKLTVSAVSGTSPTLDARLEVTYDGTNYVTAKAWAQKTGAANETIEFNVALAVSARWARTIGGSATPTVTAKIDTIDTLTYR